MKLLDRSLVEGISFNPYYQITNKHKYIDLASNNYLGLAEDSRIKSAAIQAIEVYGTSMCGTPIATGYIDLFEKVEKKLSDFVGLEETIIFPSCYQANNGIFSMLVENEDVILVDRYAHSSLMQGIKSVGCKVIPFMHNDMDHLEKVLKRSQSYNNIFVVTESVFSTEGSIAPLDRILALCEKYNAMSIVDDSHGIGVIGENGKGVLEHFHIKDFDGIYTASLGKALANSGGMVSANKKTIEVLRHYCPHLIYSTAITPASLGGILAALDVIEKDYEKLKAVLGDYKNTICQATNLFIDSLTPINALRTGGANTTLLVTKKLFEQGIYTTPFIEPSVPKNEGVVRMIAGAGLTKEQVCYVANVIREIL